MSAGPSAAGTYTVTTPHDGGAGSLRDAISYANSNLGTTITFDIPDTDTGYASVYWTIRPLSELPPVTGTGTVIDGSTQTANTGDTNPNEPKILLDPEPALSRFRGLAITAPNCTVKNLAICEFASG